MIHKREHPDYKYQPRRRNQNRTAGRDGSPSRSQGNASFNVSRSLKQEDASPRGAQGPNSPQSGISLSPPTTPNHGLSPPTPPTTPRGQHYANQVIAVRPTPSRRPCSIRFAKFLEERFLPLVSPSRRDAISLRAGRPSAATAEQQRVPTAATGSSDRILQRVSASASSATAATAIRRRFSVHRRRRGATDRRGSIERARFSGRGGSEHFVEPSGMRGREQRAGPVPPTSSAVDAHASLGEHRVPVDLQQVIR